MRPLLRYYLLMPFFNIDTLYAISFFLSRYYAAIAALPPLMTLLRAALHSDAEAAAFASLILFRC